MEVDHETTATIETDPNPRAETRVEVPDPTPEEGATADQGTRDPALMNETITGASHQNTADHLLGIADQLKVGVRVTSTANSFPLAFIAAHSTMLQNVLLIPISALKIANTAISIMLR